MHITELRSAINELRAVNGLGGVPFTVGPITAAATVTNGVHIIDQRTAQQCSGAGVTAVTASAAALESSPGGC